MSITATERTTADVATGPLPVISKEETRPALRCDICRRRAGTTELRVVPDRVFVSVCGRGECRDHVRRNLSRLADGFGRVLAL